MSDTYERGEKAFLVDGEKPSLLTDCKDCLPVAESLNCIRFSQFFVLPRTASFEAKPSYLVLPSTQIEIPNLGDVAVKIADTLVNQWSDFFAGKFRDDKIKKRRNGRVRELRPRLPSMLGLAAPKSANELKALHAEIVARYDARFKKTDYASWNSRRPLVGLCAVYEQCWTVLGYMRGELVSSISLAPGEQVVLEYHTWDKSTFKSEKELTEELELRLSSKLTQRDTKELVGELTTQSGAKLSEQLNLTIPIPLGDAVIPVGVTTGTELSQQLNTKLTATLGSVTERTDEAAASLKNQHKVRIESPAIKDASPNRRGRLPIRIAATR